MNAYGILKTVHVLSVIVWLGGVGAIWIGALRLGRAEQRTTLAALMPSVTRFGQRIAGPFSGLTLLSGIAVAAVADLWSQFWIQLGFAGFVIAAIIGATMVRSSWAGLGKLLAAPAPSDAALAAAVRRARVSCWSYVLVLAAVVVIMVLKPTLGA